MATSSVIQLQPEAALTASTTGSDKSLAPRWGRFIGFLDVSVNDGATTVDAKIQHSPDGVTYEDLQAFTQLVNTTGAESIEITAGAVYGHVRSVVTLAGTPAATVKVQLWYDSNK